MGDCCDDAQTVEEIALRAALSVQKTAMRAVGFCYSCGAQIQGVFCDSDCADDFKRQSLARSQRGK